MACQTLNSNLCLPYLHHFTDLGYLSKERKQFLRNLLFGKMTAIQRKLEKVEEKCLSLQHSILLSFLLNHVIIVKAVESRVIFNIVVVLTQFLMFLLALKAILLLVPVHVLVPQILVIKLTKNVLLFLVRHLPANRRFFNFTPLLPLP